MARPRGTSRVTQPGSDPDRPHIAGPPELPSIRQRRPVLFWTLIVAVAAMVLPLILGFFQALG